MQWTANKPIIDGWYWIRLKYKGDIVCLNIQLDRYSKIEPPGQLYYEAYTNGYEWEYDFDLNTESELFYGPIDPTSLNEPIVLDPFATDDSFRWAKNEEIM